MEQSQRKYVISAIVFAIWTLVVVVSLCTFFKSRSSLAIQARGLSLTILLALTQWFIMLWLGFRGMNGRSGLPCVMDLWIPGTLLPLWAGALLARFIRIMFLHRTSQYRLNSSLTNFSTTLPKHRHSMGLAIYPSASLSSTKSYPKLDRWFHTHRIWFGSRGLTLGLMGFLFFNLVVTMLLHILATFNKKTSYCPGGWELYPSLIISGFLLALEWPVFLLMFRDLHETFGIRLEWVIHLILAPCTILIQSMLLLMPRSLSQAAYLSLHIITMILMCTMHLLTVGYPLWWARREFKIFKSLLSFFNTRAQSLPPQQTTRSQTNILLLEAPLGSPLSAQPNLDQVMDDPVMFIDFKTFAAHNFCVENVLFFERFAALKSQRSSMISQKTTSTTTRDASSEPSASDQHPNMAVGSITSASSLTWTIGANLKEPTVEKIKEEDKSPSSHRGTRRRSLFITCPQSVFKEGAADYIASSSKSNISRDLSYMGHHPVASPLLPNSLEPCNPIQAEVLSIYREFIAQDSPLQINLSAQTKRSISDAVYAGNLAPTILKPAFDEVYSLLAHDVFPRYLRSLDAANGGSINL